MKRFSVLLLILLCLCFNIIATPAVAVNTFKEGFYKVTDFNLSPTNIYNIQNISSSEAYVLIFDKNLNLQQSIRLLPESSKFKLVFLKPDYKIILVGEGEVYIS